MSGPIVLVLTRDLAAPAERAFDAWLDPEKARQFLFATAEGEITRCEFDARVGGGFTIIDRRGRMDAVHRGRFLEIDRPRRLAFLFSAQPDGDDDWPRVTVEVRSRAGGCTATLTHEMDPKWATYESQTRRGWTTILENLRRTSQGTHG